MKIVVTGAAGFIGNAVAQHLVAARHYVLGFDLAPISNLANTVEGNFIEEQDLTALEGYEALCHIGAIGDIYLAAADPPLAYETNVLGTYRAVQAANKFGLTKIIYASTWEVYGEPRHQLIDEEHPTNPDHPYNISKLAGELVVRSKFNEVPWVCLRLGTTYGPGMPDDRVIPLFINKGLNGEAITIHGSGQQFRQFTYIDDVVRAFELALSYEHPSGLFNIVAPEKVTIADLSKLVQSHFPSTVITYEPARRADAPSAVVSADRAADQLSWYPQTTFSEGFGRLLDYCSTEHNTRES